SRRHASRMRDQSSRWDVSERADSLGLRTLRTLGHLELDALRLLEGLVAVTGDRGPVHEDVGTAAVLSNEAVALLRVEPLHRTLCHACTSFDTARDGKEHTLRSLSPQCLVPCHQRQVLAHYVLATSDKHPTFQGFGGKSLLC